MANRVYEMTLKIGASISKAFRPEALSAAQALKVLGEKGQESGKLLKKFAADERATERFSHLSTAAKDAQAKLDQAKGAVARFAAAEKAAGGPTKDSAKWMAAGAKAVASAEKELKRISTSASKAGAALHAAGVNTFDLANEQKRLATALVVTERHVKALAAVEKSRERLFGKRAEAGPLGATIKGQVGGIAADAAKLAAVAAGAGAALVGLAKHTIDVGDEIADTATNMGISTKALQELRFAAERGGSSAEDFDKGFAKLNQTVGDALSGNKAAAKSFNDVGISVRSLKKLSNEARFDVVADAIGKIKDPAQRAAAAQNFLGKTSKSMVGFFAEGSKGIAEMRKQSVGILSPTAIANASKAKDAMQSAGAAFKGVGNILGAELLPVATEVLGEFTAWVTKNQGAIQKWAKEAAKWVTGSLVPALKDIGPKVLSVGKGFADFAGWVTKLVGGVGNLSAGLVALRFAPLAVNLVRATIELGRYVAAKWAAVAATKALNAAEGGGVPGIGAGNAAATGKQIGGAANLAMVAAAAAVGWKIGSEIDERLQISDRIGQDTSALKKESAAQGVGAFGLLGVPGLIQFFRNRAAVDEANAGIAAHQARLAKGRGALDASVTPAGRGIEADELRARLRGGGNEKVLRLEHKISVEGSASQKEIEAAIRSTMPGLKESVRALIQNDLAERRRVSFG